MDSGEENCSCDWGGKLLWRLGRKTVVESGEENCSKEWGGNCSED